MHVSRHTFWVYVTSPCSSKAPQTLTACSHRIMFSNSHVSVWDAGHVSQYHQRIPVLQLVVVKLWRLLKGPYSPKCRVKSWFHSLLHWNKGNKSNVRGEISARGWNMSRLSVIFWHHINDWCCRPRLVGSEGRISSFLTALRFNLLLKLHRDKERHSCKMLNALSYIY